jgi:hypothetical protein
VRLKLSEKLCHFVSHSCFFEEEKFASQYHPRHNHQQIDQKVDHDKDRKEHKKPHDKPTSPPDSPSWNNIATELPKLPHATTNLQIKAELHFFPVFLSLPLNRQDEFCASKARAHSLDRSLVCLRGDNRQRSLVHARGTRSVEKLRMVSSGWMNRDEDGGSIRFFWVLNRPQEKKQHARLSSGWMNRDEDEGSVRFFWVLNRPQEIKQQARLSSGWMNGDEDEGSVRCFWVLNRAECTRENNM